MGPSRSSFTLGRGFNHEERSSHCCCERGDRLDRHFRSGLRGDRNGRRCAEIIAALDIQLLDNARNSLDFGLIAEGGTGGTLTLTPAGVDTCGSGLVCNGPFETPLFTLDGERRRGRQPVDHRRARSICSRRQHHHDGGVARAQLDTSQHARAPAARTTFEVGGTLTVGADQAVGDYTTGRVRSRRGLQLSFPPAPRAPGLPRGPLRHARSGPFLGRRRTTLRRINRTGLGVEP